MSDTPSPDSLPLRGKRILVVEDEFLILLDIQGILESAGATAILTASRVEDALKAIDGGDKFDAGVLDLKLDKGTSFPVAEKLMAGNVPFIFLTGAPDDNEISHEFKAAPVVGKPFDSAALVAALQRALSQ